MPITNVLLVRAAYGWDEVTRPSSITAYSRREALYGLGANASPADVDRTANARLDIIATPRFQYDAEHQPLSLTELAYRGYGVGDTLPMTVDAGNVTERVISLAVSEDDNSGQATVTASLHDVVMYASPLENFVAMLSQAVKKMIPGTGRGDWKEAQPVTPPATPAPVSAWVPPAVAGWSELTAPPTPFENGDPNYAATIGGLILVGAGWGAGSGQSTDPFWTYDPGAGIYDAVASGPTGGAYGNLIAGAGTPGGTAWAFSNGGTGVANYDGAWHNLGAQPHTNAGKTSCLSEDETTIYVLGGGYFWAYDIAGDSITELAYPPSPFADLSSIVETGGFVYAFHANRTAKYDIGAGTWDSGLVLPGMPTPRHSTACGLIDGTVYIAGGYTLPGAVASSVLEAFDITGASWSSLPSMSSALGGNAGAVFDGKLYVFGVEGSPSFAAKARVYAP